MAKLNGDNFFMDAKMLIDQMSDAGKAFGTTYNQNGKIGSVKVHPFIDGNGRTARLLSNLELMKSGFPPIIIKTEQRLEYYKALDKSHMTEEYQDFIDFVSDLVKDALKFYLSFLK